MTDFKVTPGVDHRTKDGRKAEWRDGGPGYPFTIGGDIWIFAEDGKSGHDKGLELVGLWDDPSTRYYQDPANAPYSANDAYQGLHTALGTWVQEALGAVTSYEDDADIADEIVAAADQMRRLEKRIEASND